MTKRRWTLWMTVPKMKQTQVVMTHLKITVFTRPARLVWHTAVPEVFILNSQYIAYWSDKDF